MPLIYHFENISIGYCIKEANIYNMSIKPFYLYGNIQDEK